MNPSSSRRFPRRPTRPPSRWSRSKATSRSGHRQYQRLSFPRRPRRCRNIPLPGHPNPSRCRSRNVRARRPHSSHLRDASRRTIRALRPRLRSEPPCSLRLSRRAFRSHGRHLRSRQRSRRPSRAESAAAPSAAAAPGSAYAAGSARARSSPYRSAAGCASLANAGRAPAFGSARAAVAGAVSEVGLGASRTAAGAPRFPHQPPAQPQPPPFAQSQPRSAEDDYARAAVPPSRGGPAQRGEPRSEARRAAGIEIGQLIENIRARCDPAWPRSSRCG